MDPQRPKQRKQPNSKLSRLRAGSGETRTQCWEEVTAPAWDSLAVILDMGIGAFLGRTSDGGRLTLTLVDNGTKERFYESSEGMSEILPELEEMLTRQPGED